MSVVVKLSRADGCAVPRPYLRALTKRGGRWVSAPGSARAFRFPDGARAALDRWRPLLREEFAGRGLRVDVIDLAGEILLSGCATAAGDPVLLAAQRDVDGLWPAVSRAVGGSVLDTRVKVNVLGDFTVLTVRHGAHLLRGNPDVEFALKRLRARLQQVGYVVRGECIRGWRP